MRPVATIRRDPRKERRNLCSVEFLIILILYVSLSLALFHHMRHHHFFNNKLDVRTIVGIVFIRGVVRVWHLKMPPTILDRRTGVCIAC